MAARISEKLLLRVFRQPFRISFARRLFPVSIPWLLRSAGIGCGVYCVGKALGALPFTVYATPQIEKVRIACNVLLI